MCKNLTLRVKRTGMKWAPGNAAAVMNLITQLIRRTQKHAKKKGIYNKAA